jgi:hypothetical protein
MKGWFNTCKSINLLLHINRKRTKITTSSHLLQRIAFDKLQHPFMIKALEKLGIE